MTNQIFSLKQHRFPFDQREFIVNPEMRKIKIILKSLIKTEVYEEDLDKVDGKAQQFAQRSFGWYFAALLLTFLSPYWFYKFITTYTIKLHDEIVAGIVCQILVFIGLLYCWLRAYQANINIVYFRYRNHDGQFILVKNNPNKHEFEFFVKKFQEVLKDAADAQTLKSIVEQIPTEILLNNFGMIVMNELQKRDVDVKSYLTFLRNSINNKTD